MIKIKLFIDRIQINLLFNFFFFLNKFCLFLAKKRKNKEYIRFNKIELLKAICLKRSFDWVSDIIKL